MPKTCELSLAGSSSFSPLPANDELEISLFGPGYGESLAVHLHGGEWMVVDSCVASVGHEPAAIQYLEDAGVDIGQQVSTIVATHWHDDHIRGLARTVERCPNARVCFSLALSRAEFLTLVEAPATGTERLSPGTREMARVLQVLRSRTGDHEAPRLLQENTLVHRTNSCEVLAISPSAAGVEKAIRSFSSLLPSPVRPHLRVASVEPNPASVALWVKSAAGSALLGADLEAETNDSVGWKAVLALKPASSGQASFIKVPHHGSVSGHDPDVWTDLMTDGPTAFLTPWRLGGKGLPTGADRQRTCQFAPSALLVGETKASDARYDSAVERTLRETVRRRRPAIGRMGHARARLSHDDSGAWRVEPVNRVAPLCAAA